MSQYPSNFPLGNPAFGQNYSLPPVSKTSGAAIASLVCGLIMCVPGITGLVAIITGIIGIKETGKPGVTGRAMAIIGLILGMLSVAGWAIGIVGIAAVFHMAKPQRTFAKNFVTDLSAGKVDVCAGETTGNITANQVAAYSKQIQGWGALQDIRVIAFNFNESGNNFAGSVTGICKFAAGPHNFQMNLVRDTSGNFKVDSFQWQN